MKEVKIGVSRLERRVLLNLSSSTNAGLLNYKKGKLIYSGEFLNNQN